MSASSAKLPDRASAVAEFHRLHGPNQSFGDRLADKVAIVAGSWRFILGFCAFLAAWALFNVLVLVQWAFDPYPFIFLNLLLSMLAALQAPIIMMSQNRQAAKDRLAASLDYEVNVKAESAIADLHDKVDRLAQLVAELAQAAEPRPRLVVPTGSDNIVLHEAAAAPA